MNYENYLIDFFINVISVFLGAIGAFFIAKWQINKQDSKQKKTQKILLKRYHNQVLEEIKYNKTTIDGMIYILKHSSNSRNDFWEWIISTTEAISIDSYRNLNNSGLEKELPANIHVALFDIYTELEDLTHQSKQAYYAHKFHLNYMGNQEKANGELNSFKQSVYNLSRVYENKVDIIKEYQITD